MVWYISQGFGIEVRVYTHKPIPLSFCFSLSCSLVKQWTYIHIIQVFSVIWCLSSDAIFACIFCPFSTQLHFTFLTPTFLPYVYPCYVLPLMSFTLTNRRQEHNLIGTTGHWTTCLLGYRHSKTVLLWFLFTQILHWNLLHCHQMLPPLKVLDFPDMEHK